MLALAVGVALARGRGGAPGAEVVTALILLGTAAGRDRARRAADPARPLRPARGRGARRSGSAAVGALPRHGRSVAVCARAGGRRGSTGGDLAAEAPRSPRVVRPGCRRWGSRRWRWPGRRCFPPPRAPPASSARCADSGAPRADPRRGARRRARGGARGGRGGGPARRRAAGGAGGRLRAGAAPARQRDAERSRGARSPARPGGARGRGGSGSEAGRSGGGGGRTGAGGERRDARGRTGAGDKPGRAPATTNGRPPRLAPARRLTRPRRRARWRRRLRIWLARRARKARPATGPTRRTGRAAFHATIRARRAPPRADRARQAAIPKRATWNSSGAISTTPHRPAAPAIQAVGSAPRSAGAIWRSSGRQGAARDSLQRLQRSAEQLRARVSRGELGDGDAQAMRSFGRAANGKGAAPGGTGDDGAPAPKLPRRIAKGRDRARANDAGG